MLSECGVSFHLLMLTRHGPSDITLLTFRSAKGGYIHRKEEWETYSRVLDVQHGKVVVGSEQQSSNYRSCAGSSEESRLFRRKHSVVHEE